MEDIREKISLYFINKLEKDGEIKDTREEGENNKWHIDDVTGSLNSLAANEKIVLEKFEIKKDQLTTEALVCIEKGSPEVRLWTLAGEKLLKKDLEEKLGGKEYATSGFSTSMGKKWISYNKQTDEITRAVKDQVKDEFQEQVINYQNGKASENDITQLKKRKYLKQVVIKTFKAIKGPKFNVKDEDVMRTLTTELLLSGEWKNKLLKEPNLESLGQVPKHGSLHPLLKMRDTYRQILLELGFEEMPTNRYVESSFWNFDALFQPQQHPVRDAHDTFFLSDPKFANRLGEEKYVERVKEMHEKGGNGSIGWRYKWDLEESKKNIFRTHTTAISSNMLYQLAQEKEFQPKKYFSIDRVFRNETLDSTHLAEFHQIEGLIADYDLTIGDLMGIIGSFFEKVGIPKSNLKFKPAYNPYTEPSLEIFSFHRGLKKWVEIGNSGIFRPEMLLPMGLPENVKVIAWGLSVERPTMILYGIDNIRDLCGCDLDIKKIIQHPIVRIEKQQELSEEKAKKKN